MDARTGEIYPSREAAIEAGVPDEAIVQGHEKTLRSLSRMIAKDAAEKRRRRRKAEKLSRKRNSRR